jgi:heme/copper-type cytochrome/quinol oxidase subunit 2
VVDTSTAPPPVDQPRPRRSGALSILVVTALVVTAVAIGAYQAGERRATPTPTSTGAAGGFGANVTSVPTPSATTAPPKARVIGRLVTKNLGTEQTPNRVYLATGQAGTHPKFVARPGELIRIQVDNKDTVLHSLTLDPAEVNLDAWAGKISLTEAFRAPRRPGTYTYYCRYRKAGMSGTLVVRGTPVPK